MHIPIGSKVRRSLAALLAAVLLASSCLAASVGGVLKQDDLQVGTQTSVQTGVYWNSALSSRQTEHVITYTPNDTVQPTVVFGTTLYGRSTMSYLADWAKKQGKTVVAGINGSFFELANGMPIGLIVTDGVLRSSGNNNAVGFRADGTAVIGTPQLYVTLDEGTAATVVINYNKAATKNNGIVLYSRDFDTYTKNTLDCYNVVLAPVDPAQTTLGLSDELELSVRFAGECYSCEIPEGGFVLSVAMDTAYKTALTDLQKLKAGDTVTVKTKVSADWADVVYACGGGDLLVTNGRAHESFTLDSAARRTCRTAVGVRADGSVVLYTIDGLQTGYSAGLTLKELAARMAELSCVTALNLDGGGSTILGGSYPGYDSLSTLNKPSDGSQRKCANFIFLTMDTQAAEEASLLHLYPYDAIALPDGQISFAVTATDDDYRTAAVPEKITYSAEGGTMDGRVFTAGAAGTATVQAASENAAGQVNVRIIDAPSTITISRGGKALSSSTGTTVSAGSAVSFAASAKYNSLPVYAENASFQWSVSGNIGTVDANGVFTAATIYEARSGSLTARCGSAAVTIPITVQAKALSMADMKGHWAADMVEKLYQDGVLTGSTNAAGALIFRPDDNMTRQEFTVALIRAVGVNPADYAAVELPFADLDQIASWALPSMRAAYALGYVTGSNTGGQLLAKPNGTISRQEAMTILGRAQTLGEARDDLSAFSDRAAVADWARDYVSAMVAQGVISGSNGKLNPTGSVTRAQVAKMLYYLK